MSSLFQPVPLGGDWHFNAVVGGWEHDAVLATGFQDLAAHGVQVLSEGGPDDSLLVPIVYNFRHAFELILKVAVRESAQVVRNHAQYHDLITDASLEREAINDRLAKTHSLGGLLDQLIALLVRGDVEALPVEVVDTIRQLDALDPSGQAFRNAHVKDKTLKAMVPARPNQQLVDVRQLGQRLSEAFKLVAYGHLSVLDELLDIQQDMLSGGE
ncbi:MAG: hypothetical protein LC808_37330 [Actinobacteria bacterium]|nr:hypothetical protein [Actinomycetota bacterium]